MQFFDYKVSNFVKSDILEEQINQNFKQKISQVREDDPFKNARIREIEYEKKNIEALNCLKEKESKSKKRKRKDVSLQISEAVKNEKIKTMIEFD